jgi:hypothetical protein
MMTRRVALEAKPEGKRQLEDLGVDGKIKFSILYHYKKRDR